MRSHAIILGASLVLSGYSSVFAQEQELALSGADSLLFLSQEDRQTAFGNIAAMSTTRTVSTGDDYLELASEPRDWNEFSYVVDGVSYTLDDYFSRPASRGLLVVQDGKVLLERYAEGNDEETRWVSFSVTKSVTSLLIGAAIKDGYIANVDELVSDYIPRLKETSYGDVRIKDVLHMASGVGWDEDYASQVSDVAIAGAYNGVQLVNYLADLPKVAEPGEKFNYNTGETNLAGELLRSAIGNNASTYLEHKIWKPFGMEHDAYWLISGEGGVETGGCCINATLRDYARIGLFVLADGKLSDGTRVVPEGWIEESTSPSEGSDSYGYLWWLYDEGAFSARGIFQQRIFIDPARNAVIATHGNALNAVGDEDAAHTDAIIMALRKAI